LRLMSLGAFFLQAKNEWHRHADTNVRKTDPGSREWLRV